MPLNPSRSRGRAIGWLCIKNKIRRLNNSRHRVQIALLQTETSFIFNRSVISPLNEARRSKNSVSLPLPSLPWKSKLYRRFRSRISRPGAIRSPITRKSLPLMSFAFLKRASPPMPSAFWLLPWKIFIPNLPGTSFLVRRQYAIVLVFIALLATTRHFTAKRAQAAMKSFSSAGAVKSLPTRPATCLA